MGVLHYFLGVAIKQDHEGGSKTWIGQSNYSINVLEKYGMEDSKPVAAGSL